MINKIRIGISACLLGHKVRYDGGHKHAPHIIQTLEHFFDFVPVCPETECGMPSPREPMSLNGEAAHPRLITNITRQDLTDKMTNWIRPRIDQLAGEKLYGFVFKSKSPSCGLHRVKIFNDEGVPVPCGRGLFSAAFSTRFPHTPSEEAERLHDPALCETFIEKVFAARHICDKRYP